MTNDSPSSRTSRRSAGLYSLLNVLLVFGIIILINYFGFRHYIHKDLSASQFYTLSPKTVKILQELPAPLTIYTFMDENSAQGEQISTLLKEYQRVGGKNIVLEKIDPDYDQARAKSLQKELHFDGNTALVMFQYTDPVTHASNTQFVKLEDLFDVNPLTRQSTFRGEQLFTSALIASIEGKMSKVYFTIGHGEHSLQEGESSYHLAGEALKYENIKPAELSIAQKGEIPADADGVIIAGPSIAFSQIEIEALDHYLANNGKLMVLLDPYVVSGLTDLLQKYSLKYEDDLILWQAQGTTGLETYPYAFIYQNGFSQHPITLQFLQSNYQLIIPNARSITIGGNDKTATKAVPLLQTDDTAWGWNTKAGPLPDNVSKMIFNKVTDLPGPLVVAAAYDGGQITDPSTKATVIATRIIAVGSSRFLEDKTAQPVSRNFFTNCVDWLIKKNAVLDISPKKPQDYGVSLSPMQYRTVLWCALFFIPGSALAMGVFTWFSRRK